jgi:DHA1 family bicyclomycin/chloramphenicol resistance-like MFS transporter
LSGYVAVVKNPQFFTYAFGGAIAASGLFAYLAGSPIVFMQIYKVTEQQYGWIFGLVAAGLITSSQFNNVLLKKYDSAQVMKVVLRIQSILGILLFLGSVFNMLNLYSTIALIFLFLSCQGFSFPNSSALSLAPFDKEAGSAAALMGAFQMGLGALATAVVGMTNNGTALPLTGIMAACAISGLLIVSLGGKRIAFKAKLEDVEEQAFEQIERY